MPRQKLTDHLVESLTPSQRSIVLWDTELWGFGCRIGTGGDPTYFVYYRTRHAGLKCRVILGTRRSMTCAQARKRAHDLIGRNAPHQFRLLASKAARG